MNKKVSIEGFQMQLQKVEEWYTGDESWSSVRKSKVAAPRWPVKY